MGNRDNSLKDRFSHASKKILVGLTTVDLVLAQWRMQGHQAWCVAVETLSLEGKPS